MSDETVVVNIAKLDFKTSLKLQLIKDSGLKAGFPSPADDFSTESTDLNEYLVKHPNATFIIKVDGCSMEPVIHSGDLLIVDRAIEPTHGRIVIASLDGEFTVKRLMINSGVPVLRADNPIYKPIPVKDTSAVVWGVVTFVIKHT